MSKFPEYTEMRTSDKFSQRIKELIEDQDCSSNKQFADLVGVSFPVITKAVNFGIIPTTKILIKIADALELSLPYLLGLSDENDFSQANSPSSFCDRLSELAEERNETLGSIANKMSFPRTYFYVWMKKVNLPSIEFAIAIAKYFNVSLDYLFGRTDYRK